MPTDPQRPPVVEDPLRRRILDAAFSAFTAEGYAGTSTLDIATRAKVSKRDLYALVGSKQAMLIACIRDRAARLGVSGDVPPIRDRASLEAVLVAFGERQLRVTSDPSVVAMFRLAIAEAERTPQIAEALESIAREPNRASLRRILTEARSSLAGDAHEMAEVFAALLVGSGMTDRLLGLAPAPKPSSLKRRAERAADAFLKLYARRERGSDSTLTSDSA